MKELIITAIILSVVGFAKAEKPSFESAIKEALELYQNVSTKEELQQVASRFQRIAQVENNQWLAHYYVAFTAINLCFNEQDGKRKDAILDDAQKSIDRAFELNGEKSELYTLQGWLYQARIGVSPMSRGRSYSGKAAKEFERALKANPNNPRTNYLMGMNVYNIPSFFGGGSKNALPHFEKAVEIFESTNIDCPITPQWGKVSARRMVEKCKQ